MADSIIQLSPDSTGKKVDTEELTVGLNSVHRERMQIAGDSATDIAPVTAADGLLVNLGTNNDVTVAGGPTLAEQQAQTALLTTIDSDTSALAGTVVGAELQVDVVTSALPTGAATAALQTQPGVDIGDVTVNNGAGAAAVNIQDGGNSITVDGTVGVSGTVDTELPAAAALADNTANPTVPAVGAFLMGFDGTNWDRLQTGAATGGALKVDGSAVTQPVSAASLPLPTGAATAALQTQPGVDIGDVTVNNAAGASAVNVQDGGNSLTVDGTVTANQGTAGTAWEIIGDVAADVAVPANPLSIGGRASTAVPTAVSADGDSVYAWLNRNGLAVVSAIPGAGLNADPYTLLSVGAQYTTTQTSAVLLAGGASERIIVTSIQIQVGGTTAGTLQVYFGTGAFVRGTNSAIFDGEFAPSATLKPGFAQSPPSGYRSPTLGHDVLVTTSAAINPLTITIWYYLLGV